MRSRPGVLEVWRLAESGQHDEVADAHLAWAFAESGRLEDDLVATGRSQFTYDVVVDDLRAALDWAGHRGERATGHGFARRMAHIAYGRRFFIEARVRYEEAALLAADGRQAGRDLLDAGHAAFALLQGDIGYGRFLDAAEQAERAGDVETAAVALSLAAERPSRMRAEFPKLPEWSVILQHLARAHALGDGLGDVVAAHLAPGRRPSTVPARPARRPRPPWLLLAGPGTRSPNRAPSTPWRRRPSTRGR